MLVLHGERSLLSSDVLVLPSLCMEVAGNDGVLPFGGGIIPGTKQQVQGVSRWINAAGETEYEVTTMNGHHFRRTLDDPQQPTPAGSAVNISMALRAFGVASVCVAGPVGCGKDGSSIAKTLEETGIGRYLWKSEEGTALTITVRNPEGVSTLFCEKPRYKVGQLLLGHLRTARPRILVATGVKPMDLPVVEAAFEVDGAVRVLSPHQTLLENRAERDRLIGLSSKADLLQINDVEAAALLNRPSFHCTMIREVAELFGSGTTVVTMGHRGSVLMSEGRVSCQEVCHVPHVQDMCGAGDSHLATLVYCLYLRAGKPVIPIRMCMTAAAWVASKKLQHKGPWTGIPSGEELERRIARLVRRKRRRKKRR